MGLVCSLNNNICQPFLLCATAKENLKTPLWASGLQLYSCKRAVKLAVTKRKSGKSGLTSFLYYKIFSCHKYFLFVCFCFWQFFVILWMFFVSKQDNHSLRQLTSTWTKWLTTHNRSNSLSADAVRLEEAKVQSIWIIYFL